MTSFFNTDKTMSVSHVHSLSTFLELKEKSKPEFFTCPKFVLIVEKPDVKGRGCWNN